ncbi:MAG: hypothetical protein WDM96_13470 [Lacunisphaera sp.]
MLEARANARRQALEFAQFEENLALLREQRHQLVETPLSWSGFRKFVVRRKVQECANVYSFFLSPHDTKPLPAFKPGQYLTFRLPNPLGGGPLVRCYSLSDRPHADYYRVTISARARTPPAVSWAGSARRISTTGSRRATSSTCARRPGTSSSRPPTPTDRAHRRRHRSHADLQHARHARAPAQPAPDLGVLRAAQPAGTTIFKQDLAILARDNPHINLRICYSAGARATSTARITTCRAA